MVLTETVIGAYLVATAYRHTKIFIFKRRLRRQSYEIIEGAEAFYYSGKKQGSQNHKSQTGILLIHGFTGSPAGWRKYGKELSEQGYTVYAPLLPGHGTSPEHLCITKLREWEACVENSIRLLQQSCNKIILVGISFGGNLALLSSAKRKDIDGIILVSTPLFWKSAKSRWLTFQIVRHFMLFQKKIYSKTFRAHPNFKKYYNPVYIYDTLPLIAVAQSVKGVSRTKKVLKDVRAPILIMNSAKDELIDKKTASHIYDNVSSKIKENYVVDSDMHVFLIDKHANKYYHKMTEFINKIHLKK